MEEVHRYVRGTYIDGWGVYKTTVGGAIRVDFPYVSSHGWKIPIDTFSSEVKLQLERLGCINEMRFVIGLSENNTPVTVEKFEGI